VHLPLFSAGSLGKALFFELTAIASPQRNVKID